MTDSEQLLTRLRATLDRPDTILLVGSGASLWSGLPTWGALLSHLTTFVEELGRDAAAVRDEIKAGDLLLAASYGVHQLDLREFGRFIREATKHPIAKPAEIHRLIASLGPTCFITTNYDRLLEKAIEESGTQSAPTVVTNRQPAEIADILPSYARNFVFKYHGDVEDAASIVLTRDQYRRIQHQYPATLRAFGTLLATRPVVMIGFGLRDLDFLAVKDELAAAFDGQVGEYFAIMPDFDVLRKEYWRKIYRTEIVSYSTVRGPDGSSDHSGLLELLRNLCSRIKPFGTNDSKPSATSQTELVLRLAQLATSILRKKPPTIGEILPLTVAAEPDSRGHLVHHAPDLSKHLQTFDRNYLLVGPPGSGKSFALANYAAQLATALRDQCLGEEMEISSVQIPLIASLSIYEGNLRDLLQKALPTGLDLNFVLDHPGSKIILDGINEIPRQYIESGNWASEFGKIASSATECQFILGSRNETWLSSLDLTRFRIEDINSEFVSQRFTFIENPELIKTLSKPLFFSLADSARIDLNDVTTPADVYASFFRLLELAWLNEHQIAIDFVNALEGIAFGMLESGSEFAAKEQFERALSLPGHDDTSEHGLSFLLAQGALVTLTGHRLSFFHQSVTEYLAARVLARKFAEDSASLYRHLQDKRWDQAIFLATSFLNDDDRARFLDAILSTDLTAAARAAHYVEVGQEALVNEIISRAARPQLSRLEFEEQIRLQHQLGLLPFTEAHLDALRALSHQDSDICGIGLGARFKLMPTHHETIIDELLTVDDEWNAIQCFVDIAQSSWTDQDSALLLERLRKKDEGIEVSYVLGDLLLATSTHSNLLNWCDQYILERNAARSVLINALSSLDDPKARAVLLNLVGSRDEQAIYALYANLEHHTEFLHDGELSADEATARAIVKNINLQNGEWCFLLARKLIQLNPDWRRAFDSMHADDATERFMLKVILMEEGCAADMVSASLSELSNLSDECVKILGELKYWASAPVSIILSALRTRNPILAGALLSELQGRELPLLEAGSLDWWLEWQEECLESSTRAIAWCGFMIGRFINDGNPTIRAEALAQFNGSSFERIGRLVFSEGAHLVSVDQLSSETLCRLVEHGGEYRFSAVVLGKAATEEFVRSVLLPGLAAHPHRDWIRRAIEIAGNRHNRRYLIP